MFRWTRRNFRCPNSRKERVEMKSFRIAILLALPLAAQPVRYDAGTISGLRAQSPG